MRKLIAFEQISLDGRFVDAAGDMSSWEPARAAGARCSSVADAPARRLERHHAAVRRPRAGRAPAEGVAGPGVAILGSGSIVAQLSEARPFANGNVLLRYEPEK